MHESAGTFGCTGFFVQCVCSQSTVRYPKLPKSNHYIFMWIRVVLWGWKISPLPEICNALTFHFRNSFLHNRKRKIRMRTTLGFLPS